MQSRAGAGAGAGYVARIVMYLRLVQDYVVDFFYFVLIDFPIFNVADIYVTVAAFLLIVLGLFYYREDDFERIMPSKKKKDTAS